MSTPPPAAPTAAALEHEYQHCALQPGHPDRCDLARRLAGLRDGGVDWLNLAFEQFSGFDFVAGHAALDEALRCSPGLLPARWLQFQVPWHPAPGSDTEANAFAERWSSGLAWFEALDLNRPGIAAQLATCIAAHTAFYRHYLGDDCLAGQRRYGALCTRVMAHLLPRRPSPMHAARRRRRVLFCTSFLHQHTIARLFLPLIEQLDPARFELHLFHLGPQQDAVTERAATVATLHRGPHAPQQWIKLAQGLDCDEVVHLDVGMDPTSQILAASRLAPRQSMLWGHPVSSGLASIDAVLSPDAMEPQDADAHYSERLVRLPGMGHGLASSGQPSIAPHASAHAADGPLRLFCAQSVYKLQPAFDRILVRILTALPDAELHLVPHPHAAVCGWLGDRIGATCRAAGLDPGGRIHLHGYRDLHGFLALASSCEINLDTPLWSGGMSSIDLLSLGVPTVTLEGRLMRARQTAALLRRCDQADLIAHDEDSYVQRVLALAHQRASLVARRSALAAASARIDDGGRVAAFLADWLNRPQP